jgi:hypothetical protein
MTKLWIAMAFIAGMSFQHSLIGEYARYGKYIYGEIEECEIYSKECDYIIAPVSDVPAPSQPQKSESSFSVSLWLHRQSELNPNRGTMA